MTIEGGTITFSSGRKRRAHLDIIGISPRLDIFDGYDSVLFNSISEDWRDNDEEPADRALTAEDLMELANFMVKRWLEFWYKASAGIL